MSVKHSPFDSMEFISKRTQLNEGGGFKMKEAVYAIRIHIIKIFLRELSVEVTDELI